MSSSILSTIESQLSIYGYSVFVILGNIGNVFIVIIFSRQRHNPCAIYLISSAIWNSVYLVFFLLRSIFSVNYSKETVNALAACKILIYVSNILGQIHKTMLVLACIDRFMITNRRASFRAFSTPKRAKWLIFFSIIFWLLFDIHIPIMYTIINGQCGRPAIYSIIYNVYIIIFVGLIPPVAMGIFGYLTYRNMRQMRMRVQPIGQNRPDANNSIRRIDRDLLIIVISEIFVYVVTTTPFPLALLETTISPYVISNKSVQYSQIENFITQMAILLTSVDNFIPFYIYLISSKSFYRDFKQLITNGYRKLRRQPPIMPVSATNQDSIQRDTRV